MAQLPTLSPTRAVPAGRTSVLNTPCIVTQIDVQFKDEKESN
jgi:hypothetical protein